MNGAAASATAPKPLEGTSGEGAAAILERAGRVATIRLSRPDRRNILTAEMREAIIEALAAANADPAIDAIVVAGSERAFCGGGDLSTMGGMDLETARARIAAAHALPRAIHASEKPVVAAVEGAAAGAGLALAAICDLVVASETARFVTAFEKVGLMPDLGACWSLATRLGPQAARRLLLLGADMTGVQAFEAGLCDRLVPAGTVEEAAGALALDIGRTAPATRRAVKAYFSEWPMGLEATLQREAATQPDLYRGPDLSEGAAAFREKRKPRWRSS